MLFKKAIVFRITDLLNLTASNLGATLSANAFMVEMLIMCNELGVMLNDLIAAFGGLEE